MSESYMEQCKEFQKACGTISTNYRKGFIKNLPQPR